MHPSSPVLGQLHYSPARKVLHWLSALIILWATFSGFGVSVLAPQHPLRVWVEALNPQLTSVFIPFFVLRLWLYLSGPRGAAHRGVAGLVHGLLYGVVLAVLLTGVLMMTHPVPMFGLFSLPPLLQGPATLAVMHQVHHLLCALLALLVAMHLGAVAVHAMRGQSVLSRMC